MLRLENAMPYFSPKEPLRALTLRLPDSVRVELEEIADIWTDAQRQAGSHDKVSLNEVMVRLLRVGVDGVWAEVGGRPVNKKDRDAIVSRLSAAIRKQ